MAFSATLRRSASMEASRLIESQRHHRHSVAGAVKRATTSPQFLRHSTYASSCHSSTPPSESESDAILLKTLRRELELVELCEDYEKYVVVRPPRDFPFSIEDNVGEQTVTLTRDYQGDTITVQVSKPRGVTRKNDDDEINKEVYDPNIPFLVTVVKKNGRCLEFDCTVFEDRFRIGKSCYTWYRTRILIKSVSVKNPGTEDQAAYEGGSDFSDLDRNMRREFVQYLEQRGIGEESLINFLLHYMNEKDNKEYIRWLKNVQEFIHV